MFRRITFSFLILSLLLIFKYFFSEQTNYVKIAVLDITSRTKIEDIDREFLTERLQIELSKYQRLKIVERLELKKIIEEQKLQLSGIVEKDASKIGGISGAQKIVTGSLTEVDNRYFLIVKVIDTSTSELDFIDQISGNNASELNEKIPSISYQIANTLLNLTPEEKKAEKKIETKKEKGEKPIFRNKWFPIGVAFVTPLQLPSSDFTIFGYAYSFIYGHYDRVYGVYQGFILSTDKMYGVEMGFMNFTQDLYGVQSGFLNISSQKAVGVQMGFINSADEITGVQMGFLNMAHKLTGAQIGFLNFITTGFVPFMFGLNISF